jgi:hypothetical protein
MDNNASRIAHSLIEQHPIINQTAKKILEYKPSWFLNNLERDYNLQFRGNAEQTPVQFSAQNSLQSQQTQAPQQSVINNIDDGPSNIIDEVITYNPTQQQTNITTQQQTNVDPGPIKFDVKLFEYNKKSVTELKLGDEFKEDLEKIELEIKQTIDKKKEMIEQMIFSFKFKESISKKSEYFTRILDKLSKTPGIAYEQKGDKLVLQFSSKKEIEGALENLFDSKDGILDKIFKEIKNSKDPRVQKCLEGLMKQIAENKIDLKTPEGEKAFNLMRLSIVKTLLNDQNSNLRDVIKNIVRDRVCDRMTKKFEGIFEIFNIKNTKSFLDKSFGKLGTTGVNPLEAYVNKQVNINIDMINDGITNGLNDKMKSLDTELQPFFDKMARDISNQPRVISRL